MKRLARFIVSLPLVGKLCIRTLIFKLYLSTSSAERDSAYVSFIALMGFSIFFHGVQAWMGMQILALGDCPVIVRMIGGFYGIINITVILTQIYLVSRVRRFLLRGKFPSRKKCWRHYTNSEARKMLVTTMGLQLIFMFLFLWYM